jgi:hypothetical protein
MEGNSYGLMTGRKLLQALKLKIIRNEEYLRTVIEYIHHNPVKLKPVHPWRRSKDAEYSC